jgi:hypothetical protein
LKVTEDNRKHPRPEESNVVDFLYRLGGFAGILPTILLGRQ